MANTFLRNVWYVGLTTKDLKINSMQSRLILGEPVVFYRDSHGVVSALRDVCPHRGIPLSYGRVVNDQVECPYHGWKFNHEGTCTEIPSLCEGQNIDCTKIKVKHYPAQEQQGLIWVFMGDKDFDLSKAPPIPYMGPLPKDVKPRIIEKCIFPCHIDHAVIGLMDPAHGPYVHKSWFWRSEKTMHEKRKKFAPVSHGFQMVRHQPSSNSKAYKILGGVPTTEITFSLPCVRVEHVQVGKRNFYSYTALTPMNEKETMVHQLAYWDFAWLSIIKPAIHKFAKVFLNQDMQAVSKQQDGLKYDPTLMLIKDADTQARWYYSLKSEWDQHLTENRPFVNPVPETELRWRS
ncbi:MAG: aromatic ring-hydroxylating dioxygenase subunit alpha [Bdellovibrionaceae bacterium]|nr:aromatic ring-hydroxylating dioxygenase subunit alpha [Pseudobdellovibrionaceae bacterium]